MLLADLGTGWSKVLDTEREELKVYPTRELLLFAWPLAIWEGGGP
ncbi:MAG: hypothetical protein ACE5LX_04950 [Nitrospinota bacterium]